MTFPVTTTVDDGLGDITGSLSWAIGQVNGDTTDSSASPDMISFNIPGNAPATIAPTGAEPPLTNPAIIDGTTQPDGGAAVRDPIQIDGGALPSGTFDGLTLASGSDGSSVLGISITDFSGNGLVIESGNNKITGDDLGVDKTGSVAAGNTNSGIDVISGTGNTISGNVSAANGFDGVTIVGSGTSGNLVEDNFLGTDPAGDTGLGNSDSGVSIFGGASSNTVSGDTIADNGANGYGGVDISGSGTSSNVLEGNTITQNMFDGVDVFGGATGNTIGAGDTITRNGWGGVDISGSGTSGNVVEGEYIGTDSADDTGLGNGLVGVTIFGGATDNTIGVGGVIVTSTGISTDALSPGNTIASNGAGGLDIEDSGTSGNVVSGNFIGTDAAGDTDLGNSINGVEILGGASGNTIGGTVANTIADNTADGVNINGPGTSGNLVAGNYIGTDSAGDPGLGNTNAGVDVYGGASSNTISGNTIADNGAGMYAAVILANSGTSHNVVSGNTITANVHEGVAIFNGATNNTIGGTAAAANTITSNGSDGVFISDSGTSGNMVEGDYIGTDSSSHAGLGNTFYGVYIQNGATSNTVSGSTIANNGTSSNSLGGVLITGTATSDNVVSGDTITGNAGDGVEIFTGASGNRIGGTAAAADTITLNHGSGVVIAGTGTTGNVVEGDFLGTDAAGATGLGNIYQGVYITNGATGNTVGGTASGSANTIAGNGTAASSSHFYANLAITDSGTSGNTVEGNYIGTNAASASNLGVPDNYGVFIGYGASGNTVGGDTAAARNIVSGNTSVGVYIFDSDPAGNLIQGNYIGTNVGGNAALANATTGLLIASDGTAGEPSSHNLVIDNVLSGNGESGVAIENASGNTIQDNLIGTDASGSAALGNGWDGVHLEWLQGTPPIGTGAPDNTIVRNTISANAMYGVLIEYSGSTGNVVQGNAIGTVVGNTLGGVKIDLGANGNTIGGSTATGNVISGNGGPGVIITGSGSSNNVVAGNDIGVLSDGKTGLDNMGDGVAINGGATGNTVGGTTASAANTIANNTGNGVSISDSGTSGNVVEGNYIGTNAGAATKIGNGGDGVEVFNSASGNTIGGTASGAGNVIAYNKKGVVVGSSPTDTAIHDAILGNSIYANTVLGIDLGNDGVTPNDSAGHTGPNLSQDFPVITAAYTVNSTTTITGTVSGPANSTLRVELFSNPVADPSGYGQGQVFLGDVTVTTGVGGGGSFTFSPSSPVPVGLVISATATDVNGDTSEFAKDVSVSATAPLDIGYQIAGPVYNPVKHVYSESVNLTNDGTSAVSNFRFVLEGLTPGVTLTNASGTTSDGSPYVVVAGPLGPGQSTTVTLTFTKSSSSLFINYTPEFVPNS
jgi:parallel beta-helix repeat protein